MGQYANHIVPGVAEIAGGNPGMTVVAGSQHGMEDEWYGVAQKMASEENVKTQTPETSEVQSAQEYQ